MATETATPHEDDSAAWVRRGVFAGVLVIGWLFIAWNNKFHVTAPVVFVCLGYLAVISTVYNLWRTGAAVGASEAEDATWGRPIGARGELEKEKRTLLKAIKEAEFDFAMGKLSKTDADELIRSYRARAIEVIKELDRVEAGAALSTRDQIAREVKARIELALSDKPSKRAKNAVAAKADEVAAKIDAAAARLGAAAAKAEAKAEAKADKAEAKAEKAEAKADAKAEAAGEKAVEAKAEAKPEEAEAAPAAATEPEAAKAEAT